MYNIIPAADLLLLYNVCTPQAQGSLVADTRAHCTVHHLSPLIHFGKLWLKETEHVRGCVCLCPYYIFQLDEKHRPVCMLY